MKLKSYFAGTVQEAMTLALEELGPEAMLVHSKRTAAESRRLGIYEVTFAVQDQGAVAETPASVPADASSFARVFASEREIAFEKLSSELDDLKQRIDSISSALKTAEPPNGARNSRQFSRLKALLASAEVHPDLAAAILRDAPAAGGDRAAENAAVEAHVRVEPALGCAGRPKKIVALVGPPGVGKTTTLVKLAARYGLARRRSLHLISGDVYRIAAAEQLRLYASILGVGFQTVDSPLALAQALEEQSHKELVLIDTPGRTQRDLAEVQDLAEYIGNEPDIDVHLVLSAASRADELARIVDRYSIFRPGKLLFTRIDEAARYGPLLNESHRTGKPVSFLTAGQQIPEDLEPATPARIAELILGPETEPRASQSGISLQEVH